jgi:hypothetical protein
VDERGRYLLSVTLPLPLAPPFAKLIRVSAKPIGQVTRGFTAPNRLRLVDTYVLVALAPHLRRSSLFVDLGYGAEPVTTVESFTRFRRANPDLAALGIEIDPARVSAAEPYLREGLTFRHGGFNLPLEPGESPGLVRAFNVLRQYGEHEVADALSSLARGLSPGAILIEGTSDPLGRHVCFWVWERIAAPLPVHGRQGALPFVRRWLVFGARTHPAFNPRDLQPYLPKELIHHAGPGDPADRFFAAWSRKWLATAALPPRERWRAAALGLAREGHGIGRQRGLLNRSLLALHCTPAADPIEAVFGTA